MANGSEKNDRSQTSLEIVEAERRASRTDRASLDSGLRRYIHRRPASLGVFFVTAERRRPEAAVGGPLVAAVLDAARELGLGAPQRRAATRARRARSRTRAEEEEESEEKESSCPREK